MAPSAKENGGSGRRKSMNLFSRASIAGLTHINTDVANTVPEDGEHTGEVEKKEKKKMGKRSSIFGLGPSSSPDLGLDGSMSPVKNSGSDSPRLRPRVLQKGRPASIFGSLGRKSLNNVEEGDSDQVASRTPESPMEEGAPLPTGSGFSRTVLYHGEIQTTSGMFRKKKEYLVLSETHLVRFKSQSRASETFPSIPPPFGRSNGARHPSTASIGSMQEVQSVTSHNSSDNDNRIPLSQIVTVYKVEDGRPFFTTEVVYLDEEFHGVGSIQLMLHDPKEADLWHTSIRGAAQKARLVMAVPYPDKVIRYLVAAVEGVQDYMMETFQVFRVVRRTTTPKGSQSSSDNLQKIGSSVFYLCIGTNRIHLVPLPDFSDSSGRLLSPKTSRISHGIVSLVGCRVSSDEDRFELEFRLPLRGAECLDLAASTPPDIATAIFRQWHYLKPLWLDHSFNYSGPKRIITEMQAWTTRGDDIEYFDRTLTAYCVAYGCNPANIQYAVDYEALDAPEFSLREPLYTKIYSLLELLAIMRALRYNESFGSLSFRGISLRSLHGTTDPNGSDHVTWTTRAGIDIQKYFRINPKEKSFLYQEVQALALMSHRVKRMDFTNALPGRIPKDTFDSDGEVYFRDPGCEIVGALLPLCGGQLTNVTWITLNEIALGESDLDFLIPAMHKANARLRAVECARCGLDDRGIMQMITNLERQNSTLETFDISGNPGRITLEAFQASMSRFTKLRKFNISRTSWTVGEKSLFLPEDMMTWPLEELILDGVAVNNKTIDSIATYLASDSSERLRTLSMNQCNLNGDQVALLMRAMSRTAGVARELEFHVSGNRFEKGVGEIVKAIRENFTPSHLYLRMIEFSKEDHFRELLEALRTNTTIRCLDISKASLPYDAGADTCESMYAVFAENNTLEELDISGELAHLEVTRFGIGLNHSLTGLINNTSLRMLKIEYQNLGLEGADTLASVIDNNTSLTHIYCEHNDMNLQGFTALVNALANNYSIVELPFMKDDQNTSMKRMNKDLREARQASTAAKHDHQVKNSVRKTLTTLGVAKPAKQEMTPQDMDAIVVYLNERWDHEMDRLSQFLDRNRKIAAGVPGYAPGAESLLSEEVLRPTTALSDKGILEQALSNTTPRIELKDPVEDHMDAKLVRMSMTSTVDADKNENSRALNTVAELDDDAPLRYKELPTISKEKMFELGDGEGGLFVMES